MSDTPSPTPEEIRKAAYGHVDEPKAEPEPEPKKEETPKQQEPAKVEETKTAEPDAGDKKVGGYKTRQAKPD